MSDSEGMREAVKAAAGQVSAIKHGLSGSTVPLDEDLAEAKRIIDAARPFLGGLPPKPEEPTELERRLRRSLERYGQHEPDCGAAADALDVRCACGFHDALAAVDACPKPNGLDLSDDQLRALVQDGHRGRRGQEGACEAYETSGLKCDCGYMTARRALRDELARRVDACPSGCPPTTTGGEG